MWVYFDETIPEGPRMKYSYLLAQDLPNSYPVTEFAGVAKVNGAEILIRSVTMEERQE